MKSSTHTDTSFRTKTITLPNQSIVQGGKPVSHYLQLLSHHSKTTRKEALNYIQSRYIDSSDIPNISNGTGASGNKSTDLSVDYKPIILKSAALLLDDYQSVRMAAVDLLRAVPTAALDAHSAHVVLYVFSAMTHIRPEVRETSTLVLDVLLERVPRQVCRVAFARSLTCFVSLMGWQAILENVTRQRQQAKKIGKGKKESNNNNNNGSSIIAASSLELARDVKKARTGHTKSLYMLLRAALLPNFGEEEQEQEEEEEEIDDNEDEGEEEEEEEDSEIENEIDEESDSENDSDVEMTDSREVHKQTSNNSKANINDDTNDTRLISNSKKNTKEFTQEEQKAQLKLEKFIIKSKSESGRVAAANKRSSTNISFKFMVPETSMPYLSLALFSSPINVGFGGYSQTNSNSTNTYSTKNGNRGEIEIGSSYNQRTNKNNYSINNNDNSDDNSDNDDGDKQLIPVDPNFNPKLVTVTEDLESRQQLVQFYGPIFVEGLNVLIREGGELGRLAKQTLEIVESNIYYSNIID